MLTIAEAQRRTEEFLTGQMLEALRAVEYELPSFDTEPLNYIRDRLFIAVRQHPLSEFVVDQPDCRESNVRRDLSAEPARQARRIVL